jgi:hypothetical protein
VIELRLLAIGLFLHHKDESEIAPMGKPRALLQFLELETRCGPTSLAVLGRAETASL